MREIGFPWSEAMVERSRRSAGATIAACRAALAEGVSANMAGGTHHASADRGGGFCVFNDAAVAARLMQAEHGRRGRVPLRVAVIDLDVHQGNGTARIFRDDRWLCRRHRRDRAGAARHLPCGHRLPGTLAECRGQRALMR